MLVLKGFCQYFLFFYLSIYFVSTAATASAAAATTDGASIDPATAKIFATATYQWFVHMKTTCIKLFNKISYLQVNISKLYEP